MSQTQRAMIVPVTLLLFLLSAVTGVLVGTMPSNKWDMIVTQIQGRRIISVAPASNIHATLYVLEADQPAIREVMVDFWLPEQGHGTGSTSVPILLTSNMSAVEIPLDASLALRMEFVPSLLHTHDKPDHPIPVMSPIRVAGQ